MLNILLTTSQVKGFSAIRWWKVWQVVPNFFYLLKKKKACLPLYVLEQTTVNINFLKVVFYIRIKKVTLFMSKG